MIHPLKVKQPKAKFASIFLPELKDAPPPLLKREESRVQELTKEESELARRDKHLSSSLKLSTIAFVINADSESADSWSQYRCSFYEDILTKLSNLLSHEQRVSGYLSRVFNNIIGTRRRETMGSEEQYMAGGGGPLDEEQKQKNEILEVQSFL